MRYVTVRGVGGNCHISVRELIRTSAVGLQMKYADSFELHPGTPKLSKYSVMQLISFIYTGMGDSADRV